MSDSKFGDKPQHELPHPQEVINYLNECIELQSDTSPLTRLNISKTVVDDIIGLLGVRTAATQRLIERGKEIEEAEARCCPEDVGFEEWIGILTAKLNEAHRWLLHWSNGQRSALTHDEYWKQFTPFMQWLSRFAHNQPAELPEASSAELQRNAPLATMTTLPCDHSQGIAYCPNCSPRIGQP